MLLVARAVEEDCRHIGFCPADQRVDVGKERAGAVRDAVFDPRWDLGIDFARHEAVLLERTQCVGEHLL